MGPRWVQVGPRSQRTQLQKQTFRMGGVSKMKVSRPGVEGKLLLCLFLLCVRNVDAKAQISFGGNTPKTKVTVEVGARTGENGQ